MSVNQVAQQLQQDLQNELTTANQLLRLISIELHQIKEFTSRGGEFEAVLKQNASLVETLASIQQVDVENLPPLNHAILSLNNSNNDKSYEVHETFRNNSQIDISQ